MTPKQQRFVDEYLIDLNATQAAIRAGYSERSAAEMGWENLRKPQIIAAIKESTDARAERVEITQDYVLGVIKETVDACRADKGKKNFQPAHVLRGSELLGKHLGTFIERTEGTVEHRFVRVIPDS